MAWTEEEEEEGVPQVNDGEQCCNNQSFLWTREVSYHFTGDQMEEIKNINFEIECAEIQIYTRVWFTQVCQFQIYISCNSADKIKDNVPFAVFALDPPLCEWAEDAFD